MYVMTTKDSNRKTGCLAISLEKKINFPNQKVYSDRTGNHEHMWNIFQRLSILSYKELN